MKTCVYVDAYNLYYGSLRGTAHRWLDLGALFKLILPKDDIVRIRYCTAKVKPRPGKTGTDVRQETYLRALRTVPGVSVHLGHYQTREVPMRLVNPPPGGPDKARVFKTEEKGSDVNLASYMLVDAMRNECDQTVLMSNDSDLALPVQLIREELKKRVLVITPTTNNGRHQSAELRKLASEMRGLRAGPLSASQFPQTITDAQGTFHKPSGW